ncbi:acyl-CoA dehydrogenase family protein [Herminiimonas arsenitoxidans]|uniref:acyl-CoA dehydrogenase family protein n=1 Tax=Herminiimonas arsenitoxidans TaxID=1809410 RepID=UPI0009703699|nr:acyl-CoA dehydrogenase family protein [Herminiimonas arsenitoxidans]
MNEHQDELDIIRDQARRFLDDAAQPEYLKKLLEQPGTLDRQTWQSAIDLGWPAILHAEEHGGIGLGWSGLCVLAEELGRKAVSLPLLMSASVARLVLNSGTSNEQKEVALSLVSGEQQACLIVQEEGDVGLALHPVIAYKDGKLNGQTTITAFAASADYALVPAQQDGVLHLILVALNQSGVTRTLEATIDNSRAYAALRFDAAAAYSLVSGDAAVAQLWEIASAAALVTAFEQLGGAQICLEMARDYALERKAFGQPIGRFQSIKSKLADMYVRIEIARGCALDALAALEHGDVSWKALAAAARVGAIDAYEIAARENIQTHGAIGVTWEAMPHHHYRRSRALAVELGCAVVWRERLLSESGIGNLA